MATAVSPSKEEGMTEGQVDKLVDIFRAALRKARTDFGLDASQQVCELSELGSELVSVVRKRIEAVSNLIRRVVTVDRTRKPKQALEATGRAVYCDDDVVKAMPKGEGEKTEVVFFTLGRFISDADLEKEYELRGLKPADPYSLAQVNADDPAFADDRPNGTHWQDAKGNWCFAAFVRWLGERDVNVSRDDGSGWSGGWWFAGVRK